MNGIVNIDAYTSNKDNIIENWSPENGTQGLEDEKLLVIGCMSVMLGKTQLQTKNCLKGVSDET